MFMTMQHFSDEAETANQAFWLQYCGLFTTSCQFSWLSFFSNCWSFCWSGHWVGLTTRKMQAISSVSESTQPIVWSSSLQMRQLDFNHVARDNCIWGHTNHAHEWLIKTNKNNWVICYQLSVLGLRNWSSHSDWSDFSSSFWLCARCSICLSLNWYVMNINKYIMRNKGRSAAKAPIIQ